MVKMHKLTKGGQTIYPATIYNAVVNPKTRKSLTTEISELTQKSENVISKNDSSYIGLQNDVKLMSTNFNKIKELQLPASYFKNGYGINDSGVMVPSSSVACVEFIRFNPSEPVTLASSSGDKTILKVLVYNEADEGASEIHKISLSDNTFDSKQMQLRTLTLLKI